MDELNTKLLPIVVSVISDYKDDLGRSFQLALSHTGYDSLRFDSQSKATGYNYYFFVLFFASRSKLHAGRVAAPRHRLRLTPVRLPIQSHRVQLLLFCTFFASRSKLHAGTVAAPRHQVRLTPVRLAIQSHRVQLTPFWRVIINMFVQCPSTSGS